ncbi:hypothetical protein GCM10025786_12010 [Nocardioides caeni]
MQGGRDERRVGPGQLDELRRGGLPGNDEGIKHAEFATSQSVECPRNRVPDRGTRGELAEIVRGRGGEVGALGQQSVQPVVGPRPQLVGE